jgi:hypothetical protein
MPLRGRLTRREQLAVAIWIVVPVIIGNTIYDLLLTRGLKEFKFRVAQHDAGQGPEASLSALMAVTAYDATWIACCSARSSCWRASPRSGCCAAPMNR